MIRRPLAGLLLVAVALGAMGIWLGRSRALVGRVRDAETGRPLAGVLVRVGGQELRTDPQGAFAVPSVHGLPPVRAEAPGYQPTAIPLVLASLLGSRSEVDLALKPSELRGTVTDAETKAGLAGATVRVGEVATQTDEQGRYELRRVLPGRPIEVKAQYYGQGEAIVYQGQAVQNVALPLLPAVVTVRDLLSKEPLPGATVKAGDQTLQSDAQGQVVFKRLAPHTEVVGTLATYAEGRITVSPGDRATLNLQPPVIRGRVTDQKGKPLANALVLWRVPGKDPSLTHTNAQGQYELRGLSTQGSLLVREAGYKRVERQLGQGVSTDFELEPFVAKGIYLNFGFLWPEQADLLKENLDLVDRTELNAVVIDVKADKGYIGFDSKLPVARQIGAFDSHVVDVRQIVAECKRRGIYTIARLVIFKDSVLAEGKPEWAVHTSKGALWYDDIGMAYGDPMRKEVWDYNVGLAVEAAQLGFDEIQFDYIRFPSDGDITETTYIKPDTRENRTTAIRDFVAYARQELDKQGVFFSVDLFGLTTSIDVDQKYGDLGIGQVFADVAPYVDYLSPMIYPSTYVPGNLNLTDPKRNPYQVVKISVADGLTRAGGTLIRPWLQHYSLYGITFGTNEFRLEKQAATEAGAYGWLFWNAGGVYDAATFDP